jgi:hypothetical protein
VAAMLAIGGHAKPGTGTLCIFGVLVVVKSLTSSLAVGAEEVSAWPLEFDDEQFATNTHLILPCGRLVCVFSILKFPNISSFNSMAYTGAYHRFFVERLGVRSFGIRRSTAQCNFL